MGRLITFSLTILILIMLGLSSQVKACGSSGKTAVKTKPPKISPHVVMLGKPIIKIVLAEPDKVDSAEVHEAKYRMFIRKQLALHEEIPSLDSEDLGGQTLAKR